jgi:uncharacterized ParB-like nuclease family protein
MLRVRPLFTVVACLSFLALGSLPLLADVLSPSSRTDAGDSVVVSRTDVSSGKSVTLSGYVTSPGQTVAIQALNQNTGKFDPIDNVPVTASGQTYALPSGARYTIYPWNYSHVYPPQYWSPQNIVPNLTTSQGHLELSAAAGSTALGTFSRAALASMHAALGPTPDPPNAFKDYGDGSTTVLFDRDGVNNPPATQWVNVAGMTSPSPSTAYSSVAWSVGSYTVEGNKTIYALICSPSGGGPYPVVIYNHGGINYGPTIGDIGSLHGNLNADGWSIPVLQPPPPTLPIADDLGQCFDWAKRGWIFAMSSYRGESIYISPPSSQNQNPPLPTGAWHSSGGSEFCLGEVTDVLALTHLIVTQTSSIMIGNPSDPVHINADGKLFMYGYSHGGCITYRAVEQGAPVDAFTVIEGFTDLSLNFLNVLGQLNPTPPTPPKHVATEDFAAISAGAVNPSGGYYYPDAAGVMGYNWRSAHYFASRGDLSIEKFKTMPIMIFHGDVDQYINSAGTLVYNPVFLDEAVEIANDIDAVKIFVGPTPPTRLACIINAGAPILRADHTFLFEPQTCPVSFSVMDAGDPCVTQLTLFLNTCKVLPLPLKPQFPGAEQPLHYLVVYHNMNHVNGGLAIKNQFDSFAEQNFGKTPGCDGLEAGCNGN